MQWMIAHSRQQASLLFPSNLLCFTPWFTNSGTSLGHGCISQAGSAANAGSDSTQIQKEKRMPLWDFGSSNLHHESMVHAVVLHWHGAQVTMVAPSAFLSSLALCGSGINSYGFVIQWQDEEFDDKDDGELEESDADMEAAIGYHQQCCHWRSAQRHGLQEDIGFWQSEVAAIWTYFSCSINYWILWLPSEPQWENQIPCAVNYGKRKHGCNHTEWLLYRLQLIWGFMLGFLYWVANVAVGVDPNSPAQAKVRHFDWLWFSYWLLAWIWSTTGVTIDDIEKDHAHMHANFVWMSDESFKIYNFTEVLCT